MGNNMKCLDCGIENEDDRNFCISCLAELQKEPYIDFQDIKKLTTSTVVFLSLSFIIELIYAWVSFSQVQLWQKVKNGLLDEEEANAMSKQYLDLLLNYMTPLSIVLLISSILVFTWIYKANKNSHALGAKNMKYSPLGSIGWYFVPILNFFKPYYAMKEIYQTSISSENWENTHISGYIWLWWSTWVLSWVITYKDFKTTFSQVIQSELSTALSGLIENLLMLLSIMFLIIIIRTVSQNQVKNFTNKETI